MAVDYKLTLLARAEKDRELVHPGLSTECGCYCHRRPGEDRPCEWCLNNSRRIPNPDPMALIAAAWQYMWVVVFAQEGRVELFHDYSDYLHTRNPKIGMDTVDVLLLATKTLEPDNWVECEIYHGEASRAVVILAEFNCDDCAGTGIVIKEATNGN